jgi:predicted metal-dependent HD superfamily phosphohydrolase
MLHQTFVSLAVSYTPDTELVQHLWREIRQHYSGKGRSYHNLSHLEHLLNELTEVRDQIDDWETILFALYYHDAIYDALRSDNEEQSARLAKVRLQQLAFPDERMERCERHILATKSHVVSDDADTNLFTDADLSILGSDPETYFAYATGVRKEYMVYSDLVYHPGRRKVLEHFLDMPQIYKTVHYRNRFEEQARRNLERELTFY